ncbi:MAG: PGPGW domain-containing protein [Sphingomonadales bacterium]
MTIRSRWRAFEHSRIGRNIMVGLGILLITLGIIVGPLPGPGFIPLFVGGLTLLLRYAQWSKRLYVRFKRRWPRHGALTDKGLRRASAKRRASIATREGD